MNVEKMRGKGLAYSIASNNKHSAILIDRLGGTWIAIALSDTNTISSHDGIVDTLLVTIDNN